MTQSDQTRISEDRREALRYALAIGSGAALTSALVSPASAQAAADNTLDRIRAEKVLRIAVLPGELPYFNKDLASGTWSGMPTISPSSVPSTTVPSVYAMVQPSPSQNRWLYLPRIAKSQT